MKDTYHDKRTFFGIIFHIGTDCKNKKNRISVTVDGVSCNLLGDALRSQAETVMGLMKAYKEPKLPFAGITSEQIAREQQRMNDQYGFVVWSNRMAGTDEDCAGRVENDPDYFLGMSEDAVRQISEEACAEDRDILRDEFANIWVNGVLIYGTVKRWNGEKAVFKIVKKLRDIFSIFTGDYCTLYIKDGELKAESCHHDGTDHFTIRTFKEDIDPEVFCQADTVETDTESLVSILSKHFGWIQFLEAKQNGHDSEKKA